MTLTNNIRQLREQRGINQGDLAQRVGTTLPVGAGGVLPSQRQRSLPLPLLL